MMSELPGSIWKRRHWIIQCGEATQSIPHDSLGSASLLLFGNSQDERRLQITLLLTPSLRWLVCHGLLIRSQVALSSAQIFKMYPFPHDSITYFSSVLYSFAA